MTKLTFNELSLETFHQWPLPLKYSMLVLGGILFGILNYWLLLSSNWYQYEILVNEEINLKSEFEKKQQLANLKAYQKQMQAVETKYGNSLKQLVKENEVSKLLNNIAQIGSSSGLIFEILSSNLEDKKKLKNELIINIQLIGKYHKLAEFFSKISNLNRLVTIKSFEIIKVNIDNKKIDFDVNNRNILRMKVVAQIPRHDS